MSYKENPTDIKLHEAEQAVLKILNELELNPAERRYVDSVANQLVETAWNFLDQVPPEDLLQMRQLVTIVAIANALGAWNLSTD